MAKYAPSALLGRISRSAGGTTFGHNRYGAYFRNRVIPTNPMTPAQTIQRGNFGTISQRWRFLTPAQRLAWSAFGENFTKTDSLGEVYTYTGLQAFVSINRNVLLYGGTIIDDAPTWTPPAALTSMTVTAVGA